MTIYALGDMMPELPADDAYWVAPSATVVGHVRLKKDAAVWFGAVLRGDNAWIEIGERSNIQDNSVVHTEPFQPVAVGAGVTVGHNVILHSATVGDNCLIGMGAILLNGCRIGQNCLIGAGAMVTEGVAIPDNSLVIGVPGRVKRQVSEAELALIRMSSEVYVKNYQRFKASLFVVA